MQPALSITYWDAFYGNGSDWGQPNTEIMSTLKKLQDSFQTANIYILDIACGNGRYTIPFAEQGARVDCVDSSGVAIAQLEQWAKDRNVAHLIQARCCNVKNFLITPETYHLVLVSGLFEYLTKMELNKVIHDIQKGTIPLGINSFVWLVQHSEASTISQEYPVAPGIVENFYLSRPGWQILSFRTELKDDFHPLEMGGRPQKHKHCIDRIVATKTKR